ncbi:MAG: class I SAM-dependent methyltransferase [Thermodesulfobacteriota bacterium]
MGIYRDYIFPYLLEFGMSRAVLQKHRMEILSRVRGDILEIGFGSGINLQFYPVEVQKVTVIEPNHALSSMAKKRIKLYKIKIEGYYQSADTLPFPDNSFDTVVSTYTLCSIKNIDKALSEIHRVLRTNGQFLFLEHGLSLDPCVQRWQNRLNSINKAIADGCNLNRNIKELIELHELRISELDKFYLEKTPKISGYNYKGIAIKTN